YIEIEDHPVVIFVNDGRIDRPMHPAGAEYEFEPVNNAVKGADQWYLLAVDFLVDGCGIRIPRKITEVGFRKLGKDAFRLADHLSPDPVLDRVELRPIKPDHRQNDVLQIHLAAMCLDRIAAILRIIAEAFDARLLQFHDE